MENYYFDLSRLPEMYNTEAVKKFMTQHGFPVYESSNAPKNKHIGSGAWHDDVLDFVAANFKEEVVPVEVKPEVVNMAVGTVEEVINSAHSFTEGADVPVEPPVEVKPKKSRKTPNPTDNNGVAERNKRP